MTTANNRITRDVATSPYSGAPDEPELAVVPRTTFVSVTGAGAPATRVWHRKKLLVADVARALTPGAAIVEHVQYRYLDSLPSTNIADFYSVNPLTELHYRALARVGDDVTPDDVAAVRRTTRCDSDDDDELELFFIPEQLVVQVMHHGPFSGELETLARLGAAAESFRVTRNGPHQEIYLDPFTLETPQDGLRTILRDPVA